MKTGQYKTPTGETVNVVQIDEENKRVEVAYAEHNHWWGEEDYKTWEAIQDDANEDTGEKVLDYVHHEETTSGISHNPITEEPKPKKKAAAKPKTKKK